LKVRPTVRTDSVLFRKPQHSGTTAAFTDPAKPRETTVVSALPAGNSSSRALHVKWSWLGTNPWLRLTTASSATLPNPVVDFRKSLRFDVWSEHTLKFALGLRETNATGAIGSDGGTSGPIEFVGAASMNVTQPMPVRTVPPDGMAHARLPPAGRTRRGIHRQRCTSNPRPALACWNTSPSFRAPVRSTTTSISIISSSWENNFLTWSLLSAPPGASIDPLTGLVTWTPTAGQAGVAYTFRVQASDAGVPPLTDSSEFTVTVVPQPEFISVARPGGDVALTWKAAPDAVYEVQTATALAGPWSVLTEVTADAATASWSGAAPAGHRRFYRVKLKS
jgi:hypothetical protein